MLPELLLDCIIGTVLGIICVLVVGTVRTGDATITPRTLLVMFFQSSSHADGAPNADAGGGGWSMELQQKLQLSSCIVSIVIGFILGVSLLRKFYIYSKSSAAAAGGEDDDVTTPLDLLQTHPVKKQKKNAEKIIITTSTDTKEIISPNSSPPMNNNRSIIGGSNKGSSKGGVVTTAAAAGGGVVATAVHSSSNNYHDDGNNNVFISPNSPLLSFFHTIVTSVLQHIKIMFFTIWTMIQSVVFYNVGGGVGGGGGTTIKNSRKNKSSASSSNTTELYNDVQRQLLIERKRIQRSNSDVDERKDKQQQQDIHKQNNNKYDNEDDDDDDEDDDYLHVTASPGITTLLDTALYHAYEAELLPTVSAASRLLADLIEMKETSALLLRECRWAVGVPLNVQGLTLSRLSRRNTTATDYDEYDEHDNQKQKEVVECEGVLADGISVVGGGVIVNQDGIPVIYRDEDRDNDDDHDHDNNNNIMTMEEAEIKHAEDILNWNEYDTIQDFAYQCYLSAKEGIHRLTTDRFAETANRTLRDTILATATSSVSEKGDEASTTTTSAPTMMTKTTASQIDLPSLSLPQQTTGLSTYSTPADVGIGRCYNPQSRRDCWESSQLNCPDYCWAEDVLTGCHRLLKALLKHRFITLVNTHGWDRYINIHSGEITNTKKKKNQHQRRSKEDGKSKRTIMTTISTIRPPIYATNDPHAFPSLEAIHALQYLVSNLLSTSIPSRLNQFRAAMEANAVVSKRLYLVKCEYRAPLRALWESCNNLNSAPKVELVERYLRDYHSTTTTATTASEGGDGGSGSTSCAVGGKGGSRKKGGISSSSLMEGGANRKTPIQMQREKLEKLITEKYWKHPPFVKALQLERYCERLEVDMSHMLLPLANLAAHIMCEWKGRVRSVAIMKDSKQQVGSDSNLSASVDENLVKVVLGWRDVPFMRELLRRLKSILRRKPDHLDESTGIRPLLLDLQGIPRYKQDLTDSSIEMPFYNPLNISADDDNDPWFELRNFTSEVDKLLELLSIPNIPFLVEDRLAGNKSLLDHIQQCTEVWDKKMFEAQYMDWFDMVKRQQELNVGEADSTTAVDGGVKQDLIPNITLSELSKVIRDAEIELSIAMASKEQLERVYKRLEALRVDKAARYKVLAQIVFDVGYRELNDGILVEYPPDDLVIEFPKLSVLGIFGQQLTLSGEVICY